MARAGITPTENTLATPLTPAHVFREKVGLLGRNPSAFAVADLLAGGQRGRLAAQGPGHGLFGVDGPGVEQFEVGVAVGDVLLVGQAGHRVLGGKAGNVVSGLHRLADGVRAEVRRRCVAAPLPQIHRDAQRLVAVALHVFERALAHRHTQTRPFRHLHPGIAGAQLAGMGQRHVGQRFELLRVVLKSWLGSGKSGVLFGRNALGGSRCLFHAGGYDTWMARKPTKGYFVKGHFVAEGSELDLELKRELKGDVDVSKTDLKKHSDKLQQLGEALMTLRQGLMDKLDLPEKLVEAIAEAKRITNFEGKRRQMQFIGKLMRKLDDDTVTAIEAALEVQHQGSAADTLRLHQAEQWRDRLIADDQALQDWLTLDPDADLQHLRSLIRQARKDAQDKASAERPGEAQRHGKSYRELFQIVRNRLDAQAQESS